MAFKDQSILESAGSEVLDTPPSILAKTRMKYGPKVANKQRVAIILSKARRMGAKIPQRKTF